MHIPGSPRDARNGAIWFGGNVGAGGNGVSASQGGTSPSGGDSGGGYYSTHDITGFGTNGIGGPNAVGSTGVLNNGLAAGPGDTRGSPFGSTPETLSHLLGGMFGSWGAPHTGMFGSADQAIAQAQQSIAGTPQLSLGQMNLADRAAVDRLGGMFGGVNQAARAWQGAQGLTPDTSGFGAFGRDFVGWNNPYGLGGSPLASIGKGIGLGALGAVNPLGAMALGGMSALGQGVNPGGVFGGMGAGMLSPLVGSALAAAGPIGQIAAPLVSQAMNYAGRQAGTSAYNAGYSAPASQGPGATNGFGGTGSALGTGAPGGSSNTQLAGLSAPEVTAPVSNPVMGPLANLFRNGGINLPLLFAAINNARRTA